MAQIKVYGLVENVDQVKEELSDLIHSCAIDALGLPSDKRFHRFFPLEKSDFLYPADRTERYIIIEISMFEGRSIETKRQLIRLLFERISDTLNISTQDIEIPFLKLPDTTGVFAGWWGTN